MEDKCCALNKLLEQGVETRDCDGDLNLVRLQSENVIECGEVWRAKKTSCLFVEKYLVDWMYKIP